MGRPRTPTNLLDARGAFKKDPQRARSEPEVREPIGPAPETLSAGALLAWREICRIAPLGVLTQADRMRLSMAAELWAEWEESPREMKPEKLRLLQSQLGAFGLSPADRAKLSVPKAKESGNPFASLRK